MSATAGTSNSADKKPVIDNYKVKYVLMKQKYQQTDLSNCRLRNRIYHVKKEIKYLKRLKRILIQKLLTSGDRFMEINLEIPDNEPGSNVEDQIIAEVAKAGCVKPATPTPPPAPPANKKRKVDPAHPPVDPRDPRPPSAASAKKPAAPNAANTPQIRFPEEMEILCNIPTSAEMQHLTAAAKASVSGIIDSVISESRAARDNNTTIPATDTAWRTPSLPSPLISPPKNSVKHDISESIERVAANLDL